MLVYGTLCAGEIWFELWQSCAQSTKHLGWIERDVLPVQQSFCWNRIKEVPEQSNFIYKVYFQAFLWLPNCNLINFSFNWWGGTPKPRNLGLLKKNQIKFAPVEGSGQEYSHWLTQRDVWQVITNRNQGPYKTIDHANTSRKVIPNPGYLNWMAKENSISNSDSPLLIFLPTLFFQ